jgi:hypothetical protein
MVDVVIDCPPIQTTFQVWGTQANKNWIIHP